MSNTGAWDEHYAGMVEPLAYGSTSYPLIAEFVADCDVVQDWGCGGGALEAYLGAGQRYVGVDSSETAAADVHSDLTMFRSHACAVVLRHVLEHNDEWAAVLDNAIASAQRKLVVCIFTPEVADTRVLFHEPDYHDVPVIAFNWLDLFHPLQAAERFSISTQRIDAPDTAFGRETLIYAEVT